MSKQGMARPNQTHTNPKNEISPVPEIQGKAKHKKAKVSPIVTGTAGAEMKVFYSLTNNSSVENSNHKA